MEVLNLYGCMMIFAIGCTIGAIFVLCVLKETSGRSLNDIESDDEFEYDNWNNLDKKPLISQKRQDISYHTFNEV